MEPYINYGDGETLSTSPQPQNEAEQHLEEELDTEEKLKPWQEWLLVILMLPEIGGIITFGIALIPAVLVMILFLLGSGGISEHAEEPSTQMIHWLMLIAIPVTWRWLIYLEKMAKVAVYLPIPIINIPVKWFMGPFMILWIGFMIWG